MASIIGYITLKSITITQHKKNLQNSISLIELENIKNLQEYVKKVSQGTNLRVTMISEDGVVLAESLVEAANMDNHSLRYEILRADKETFAHSVRESKTVKADFLYVAKKVSYKDGSIYIRLSMSLETIMSEFYFLFLKLFLLFLLFFVLAFYVLKKMNEKLVFDITQITKYLDEVSKKNYGAVIKVKYFYEFLQISLTLKNLVKRLHSRDKKKTKK